MNNPQFSVSRRSFIKVTAVAGGGLLLGFSSANAATSTSGLNEALSFNPFILISPDGFITIYSPNPEVGQGVKTAMPMIVAEELDADWSKVKVEQALLDGKKYQRQVAGGSGSLKASWATLRQAGASVRMMMLAAAAQKWKVSVDSLRTENSQVLGNNQKASYAELATEAVKQAVPTKVVLKKPSEFRLLGKSIANVDNKDIFTGKAIYGIDIKKPGMKYAVVARPPGFGQIPDKINDAAAKAIPGVFGVYPFDDKIAIVANDTWTALKARKALDISWIQKTAAENTAQHDKWLTDLLTQKPAKAFRADGDAETATRTAQEWGQRLWHNRESLRLHWPDITTALDRAEAAAAHPVVLADTADNAGGGAPSDSTFVLQEVLARGLKDVAMAVYWDPVLVDMCRDAGVGARMRVRLGGKRSEASGQAIDLDVTVRAIRENMTQDFGVVPSPFGTGVWLDADGVHLIVNDSRTQCLHPSLFTDLGLDPGQMKIVVVKSSNHFYAGFAPIAAEVIHMASPGTLTADFAAIPYQKRDPAYWPRVENPFP